jgi:hypothetical protein
VHQRCPHIVYAVRAPRLLRGGDGTASRPPFGAPPRLAPAVNASAVGAAPVPLFPEIERMIRKSGYRFSERSYASQKLAGVTRFDLSRVYRAPRGPVVVPVEQWPRAARERFARPRAGTALAPHLDRIRNAPFGERDSQAIM